MVVVVVAVVVIIAIVIIELSTRKQLTVREEGVPKPSALRRPLDQARDVRHRQHRRHTRQRPDNTFEMAQESGMIGIAKPGWQTERSKSGKRSRACCHFYSSYVSHYYSFYYSFYYD